MDITVFEKSRGPTGRAATRGRSGVRYDHGANFLTLDRPRVRQVVLEGLPTDELATIEPRIWTFDGDGTVSPPEEDDDTRYTYRRGINTLGKLLDKGCPARIVTETRIEALHRSDGRWTLADTDGGRYGPFHAVLLTPPAPQTADLLAASDGPAVHDLAGAVDAASYVAQFTVVLGYDRRVSRPNPFYGLLNDDREHAVSWIGFEDAKPGHVPEGQSVVVIQMSPSWTAKRLETDPDEHAPEAKAMAARVSGCSLKRPSWYDTQRWRYSLPVEGADVDMLAQGAEHGLFFAGDYVAGTGRIAAAMETGLDAADAIDHRFPE
jgi:predicted NAD/FAD-dependent oxidoreductase